jgi:hypothetical protein
MRIADLKSRDYIGTLLQLAIERNFGALQRTEQLKYVERADNWPSEMIDLEADPGEETNVIGWPPYRERMAALRGRLRSFFQSSGAPPIEKWHDAVRNILTLDTGYYDNWLQPRAR